MLVKAVRPMMRMAWKRRMIAELPRVLDEVTRKPATETNAKPLGRKVIQALWAAADMRMRCFIALGLNCGFYSIDISTLEAGHLVQQAIRVNPPRLAPPTIGDLAEAICGQCGSEAVVMSMPEDRCLTVMMPADRPDDGLAAIERGWSDAMEADDGRRAAERPSADWLGTWLLPAQLEEFKHAVLHRGDALRDCA